VTSRTTLVRVAWEDRAAPSSWAWLSSSLSGGPGWYLGRRDFLQALAEGFCGQFVERRVALVAGGCGATRSWGGIAASRRPPCPLRRCPKRASEEETEDRSSVAYRNTKRSGPEVRSKISSFLRAH
jgi:hypothetical protein